MVALKAVALPAKVAMGVKLDPSADRSTTTAVWLEAVLVQERLICEVEIIADPSRLKILNAKVFEMLGEPEAVVLMFDKKEKVIGLRPARLNSTGTFRVQALGTSPTHKIIRAAPFCRAFNIRMDCTTAFLQPRLDDDGVLLLDLRATVPARARRKRKLTGREWAA